MPRLDTGAPPPNRVELASPTREVAVVALIGEHDIEHYETLKSVLARAAIRARYVIVDLSECASIDSTTISLLLHTDAVTRRAGGGFAVVIPSAPGPVSRVAELMHLAELLSIYPLMGPAQASLQSTAPGS